MNGKDAPPPSTGAPRRANGSFPGTGGAQWHRTLTGRQAPEPVSAKLRMIYGNIVSDQLPANMLDLPYQPHQKTPKQRSEERRVGNERVSTDSTRWSPEHQKKKNIY